MILTIGSTLLQSHLFTFVYFFSPHKLLNILNMVQQVPELVFMNSRTPPEKKGVTLVLTVFLNWLQTYCA